jgi:hypothetical protein
VDQQLTNKVKITVIATGFDHVSGMRSAPAVAPKQTPVDLQNYTNHQAARPPAAASAVTDSGMTARLTIARRPGIELPARAVNGPGFDRSTSGDATDHELNTELDVPAFLRRSEG